MLKLFSSIIIKIFLKVICMKNKRKIERLKYHFEPKKGWMNDPNGLCKFNGIYHAFFQYYPYAKVWGPMHWGHAISKDLIHWEELEPALIPDQPYENSGGCFSGSAIEKDGVLYLFYTSVSKELGQTQSLAISHDGIHFEKYDKNPIIDKVPSDGSQDFRDPKVFKFNDKYLMICGSGKNGVGKVLLFESENLFNWTYVGVLFEDKSCGEAIECPDLFKLGDDYVLMFSMMNKYLYSTNFIVGSFDGKHFIEKYRTQNEAGPEFYAPQTFFDGERRIIIGWMFSWTKAPDKYANYAGALSIPRELKIENEELLNYPVKEAWSLLKKECKGVKIKNNKLYAFKRKFNLKEAPKDIAILEDTKTIEIFINYGEESFTLWKKKDTLFDKYRYKKEKQKEAKKNNKN